MSIDLPALEIAYQTLAIADWAQTHEIVRRPDMHETNPILGRSPPKNEINRYFVLCGVAHAAVSFILPEKYERYWQYVSISVESAYVAHNYNIGIRVRF